MKILLSAYACESNIGSEPGVGFNWALEISKLGYEVTVLTRKNNADNLNQFLKNNKSFKNISFEYFDFIKPIQKLKSYKIIPIYLYYFLWQIGAFKKAKKLNLKNKYDAVHHITFCSIHHFSLMWLLKIPFILGPIAGGDKSTFRLRWATGFRGGIVDTLRDLLNSFSYFDPFFRFSIKYAKEIAVNSKETLNFIPLKYHYKTKVISQIANQIETTKQANVINKKKLLFVGKFYYWKGMILAIKAFAKAYQKDNDLTFTLIGNGREARKLKSLAFNLGIDKNIHWIDWLEQDELFNQYIDHGIFLYPSLHDSGALVCLEAISFGMPLICLDSGGPGRISDISFSRSINPINISNNLIIDKLAESIIHYSHSDEIWKKASKSAKLHSKEFTWARQIAKFDFYKKIHEKF